MARQRKDTNLEALANFAERAKSDGDPSGFLSGGFINSDFSIVLGGCIEFNSEIPEFEQKRIITKVAFDSSIPRPIKAESLIEECAQHERDYLALPKQNFRLLTEISIYWTIDVPKIVIGDTTLVFKPKGDVGFSARSRLFQDSKSSLGFELPRNYMRLSAHISARTPFEAAERALNSIDLARASWNLSLNRGKSWRYSGGRPTPVNEIRLSPFHTIHDPKGNLAAQTYWYDPGYSRPANMFSDKPKFERLLSFSGNLRSRLTKLSYRSDIEGALIRYVRALDSADLNDTFLRLWSLLEYLTDSTHDPYKVATRRAAFMFTNRVRSQLVLTHLTNHRNRFVHAGSDTDDIESLVFLLKRYVDELLLFHIRNPFGFSSRNEAALFMDLPPNKKELQLRIKRLLDAKKYVGDGA